MPGFFFSLKEEEINRKDEVKFRGRVEAAVSLQI